MFLTTLLLGGVITLLVSFVVKSEAYTKVLQPFDFFELIGVLLFFSGLGFIFSIISQMGFFAYLTVHQFGRGMFRGFWPSMQIFLIVFTLFDLVYFRYQAAEESAGIWPYLMTALALLVIAAIVSYIKMKETNKHAFVPALFFMVVVTTIEWVPALRSDGQDYVWMMILPLLACNTYQLLLLHRLTEKKA
nr:KinB-signaling pathway activation protein [Thalassobacillus pellis]